MKDGYCGASGAVFFSFVGLISAHARFNVAAGQSSAALNPSGECESVLLDIGALLLDRDRERARQVDGRLVDVVMTVAQHTDTACI